MTDKSEHKPTPADFYLDAEKLDEGVRLPLRGRDGRLTEQWLRVRSIHSDSYQAAVTAALKQAYQANPGGELPLSEREIVKAYRHLLVTGWSFDDFSPEGAKELLDRNPTVASAVVEVAGRAGLFFPDTGASSSPGRSAK